MAQAKISRRGSGNSSLFHAYGYRGWASLSGETNSPENSIKITSEYLVKMPILVTFDLTETSVDIPNGIGTDPQMIIYSGVWSPRYRDLNGTIKGNLQLTTRSRDYSIFKTYSLTDDEYEIIYNEEEKSLLVKIDDKYGGFFFWAGTYEDQTRSSKYYRVCFYYE